MTNQFIEAAAVQESARERQHVAHSEAIARESLIAAKQSARAAKMAAWAALAAAAGVLSQLIIAIVK
jgi:hypothetical protein